MFNHIPFKFDLSDPFLNKNKFWKPEEYAMHNIDVFQIYIGWAVELRQIPNTI
jgi:hypothetical protein